MFDGAVLVAENGKVIYKDALGLANREWDIPNLSLIHISEPTRPY